MNDAMHSVEKGWYRLYWVIILCATLIIAAGCILFRLFPDTSVVLMVGKACGLDLTTLVLAGLVVVYGISVYWIERKRSEPLAMLVMSMLFTLLLLNGLIHTDPGAGAWLYVAAWIITAFFAGMFGLPFSLGVVLLAVIYVLLESQFQVMGISTVSWALLGGSAVAAWLGYLFWHKKYLAAAGDTSLNRLGTMLRSNQEQSAILIQSIADGVIVTSTDGKITLMNPAAARLTGWPIGEGIGLDVQSVVKISKESGAEIPPEQNPFKLVLQDRKQMAQTLQLTARDEKKRTISLVISPVVLMGKDLVGSVAVLRDVSEQRAEEQQRADFISTASHEMRTPVAAIEGYLALALNDKVSTIDSRARGFLEKAHSSTQHLGQLFQDLLTSAKAEDGRLTSHPAVIEMGEFLERLVEDLRFGAQKKGLAAEFIVGSSDAIDATAKQQEGQKILKPLYYVFADPDRLREVITNLFDNAVKYTDQGKVSVGLTGNNDVVQCYIRDTGAGIPADDIPHLFQKFYRVDNSATRVVGGTGLGLFIARKIIELYNGRIWVDSQLGKGSTFYINLPRLTTAQATRMQSQAEAAPATPAKTA